MDGESEDRRVRPFTNGQSIHATTVTAAMRDQVGRSDPLQSSRSFIERESICLLAYSLWEYTAENHAQVTLTKHRKHVSSPYRS